MTIYIYIMYDWYILGTHKGLCFIWGMGLKLPATSPPSHRRTKSTKLGKLHAWHGKTLRIENRKFVK